MINLARGLHCEKYKLNLRFFFFFFKFLFAVALFNNQYDNLSKTTFTKVPPRMSNVVIGRGNAAWTFHQRYVVSLYVANKQTNKKLTFRFSVLLCYCALIPHNANTTALLKPHCQLLSSVSFLSTGQSISKSESSRNTNLFCSPLFLPLTHAEHDPAPCTFCFVKIFLPTGNKFVQMPADS